MRPEMNGNRVSFEMNQPDVPGFDVAGSIDGLTNYYSLMEILGEMFKAYVKSYAKTIYLMECLLTQIEWKRDKETHTH